MPGCIVDYANKTFTVTQSWLQDFQRCPERARLSTIDPRPSTNDATVTGQGLHTFVELRLSGELNGSAYRSAESWMAATVEMDPDFTFVKVKTLETMIRHLDALCRGFDQFVLPEVPMGGLVEEKMTMPLLRHDDWTIVLEGKPDYIAPDDRIWDWKSAANEWLVRDVVPNYIQPTTYTALASYVLGRPITEFTYAIGIKPHGAVQFIDVHREVGHHAWLARIALGALLLWQALPDGPWPVVHTHYLCSPKWCSHWNECRGAEPYATVPVAMTQQRKDIMYDDQNEREYAIDEDAYNEHPATLGEVYTGETMTGMVKFTRQISHGRDNVEWFSEEWPFPVQPGMTPEQYEAISRNAWAMCRGSVYEQSGLDFTVDETGVLRELLHHHVGATEQRPQQQRPQQQQRPAQRPQSQPGRQYTPSTSYMSPSEMAIPEHLIGTPGEALWFDLVNNPSDWYDNRADKAKGIVPKGPDFKRKIDNEPIWLTSGQRQPAGGGGGYRR